MGIKAGIVPFGKYKGQPVEVLAADPQYCEWLAAQDWVRHRYADLHVLIVNNFHEPQDTPEHNALQARFLDQDFRQVVVQHIYGGEVRKRFKASIAACIWSWHAAKGWCRFASDDQETTEFLAWGRELEAAFGTADGLPLEWQTEIGFEVNGWDAVVNVWVTSPALRGRSFERRAYDGDDTSVDLEPGVRFKRLFFECKPSLGDDYPAVLRQIRARDEIPKVLLVERFQSRVLDLEQVRAFFKTADVSLILLAELAPF